MHYYPYTLNSVLNEGNEGRIYKRHAQSYLASQGIGKAEADRIIGGILHDLEIHRKTDPKYAFLLGLCRWYVTGQIADVENINRAKLVLGFVASEGHDGEYDENFNGKNLNELFDIFKPIKDEKDKNMRSQVDAKTYHNSKGYEILEMNSSEDCEKYAQYTSWCVTKGSFADYGLEWTNHCYFCLKEGFEKVKKEAGKNCPLDEYGLSMISVIVGQDGEPTYITTRWNHEHNGENHPKLCNALQVSELLDVNFYKTFVPNTRWKDAQKIIESYIKKHDLNGLERHFAVEVYDEDEDEYVEDEDKNPVVITKAEEGNYYLLQFDDKHNIITSDWKLLFDKWLDNIGKSKASPYLLCGVEDNSFFIDKVTLKPVDVPGGWVPVNNFYDGNAVVKKDGRCTWMDEDFNLMFPDATFRKCQGIRNGYAIVFLDNGKESVFLTETGSIINNDGFDSIQHTNTPGLFQVRKNNSFNYMLCDGSLLLDKYYPYLYYDKHNQVITAKTDDFKHTFLLDMDGKRIGGEYKEINSISSSYSLNDKENESEWRWIVKDDDGNMNVLSVTGELAFKKEFQDMEIVGGELKHCLDKGLVKVRHKGDGLYNYWDIKRQEYTIPGGYIDTEWPCFIKRGKGDMRYRTGDVSYNMLDNECRPVAEEWWSKYDSQKNGLYVVYNKNNKCNILDSRKKRMCSDVWFDRIDTYPTRSIMETPQLIIAHGRYVYPKLHNKYNILDLETGGLKLDVWQEETPAILPNGNIIKQNPKTGMLEINGEEFDIVYKNDNYMFGITPIGRRAGDRMQMNLLDKDGNLLVDEWFDNMTKYPLDRRRGRFYETEQGPQYYLLELGRYPYTKCKVCTEDGVFPDMWVDDCVYTGDHFYIFKDNGKWNLATYNPRGGFKTIIKDVDNVYPMHYNNDNVGLWKIINNGKEGLYDAYVDRLYGWFDEVRSEGVKELAGGGFIWEFAGIEDSSDDAVSITIERRF